MSVTNLVRAVSLGVYNLVWVFLTVKLVTEGWGPIILEALLTCYVPFWD